MGKVTQTDRAEIARLRAEVGRMMDERDAAQARIAELEAEVDRERAAHRAASERWGQEKQVVRELETERDRWKANAQEWADEAAGTEEERNALAAEVEELTAERDALAGQVASCRKALEWLIEQGIVVRLRRMGATGYYPAAKYPDEDIHPALVRERLSAAADVPLADLTGEEVPA